MSPKGTTRTPAEEARALVEALAAGDVVRTACWCEGWLLAACDVGADCGACGAPMVANPNRTTKPSAPSGQEKASAQRRTARGVADHLIERDRRE